MDSSRKKLTIKWRRTAVTSPTHIWKNDADLGTPPRWNMSPHGDSNLSLSESPGPEGFGELSLNTPKRKAEVLSETVPSLGKVKLRKLSKKHFEAFKTSKVSFNCKSSSLWYVVLAHASLSVFVNGLLINLTLAPLITGRTRGPLQPAQIHREAENITISISRFCFEKEREDT